MSLLGFTSCKGDHDDWRHQDTKSDDTPYYTILLSRWVGRKKKTTSDPMGQWSSITLVGKQEREIAIITACCVCQQKGDEGCTIYHQQQMDFEQNGQRQITLWK
jgi:hypothetical protein